MLASLPGRYADTQGGSNTSGEEVKEVMGVKASVHCKRTKAAVMP
jgi:hypothetical protein